MFKFNILVIASLIYLFVEYLGFRLLPIVDDMSSKSENFHKINLSNELTKFEFGMFFRKMERNTRSVSLMLENNFLNVKRITIRNLIVVYSIIILQLFYNHSISGINSSQFYLPFFLLCPRCPPAPVPKCGL